MESAEVKPTTAKTTSKAAAAAKTSAKTPTSIQNKMTVAQAFPKGNKRVTQVESSDSEKDYDTDEETKEGKYIH